VGEGRLAGAGDAREADEETKWKIHIQFLQIVTGCAAEFELRLAGFTTLGGDGDRFAAVEPGKGSNPILGGLAVGRTSHGALIHQLASVDARGGADVQNLVGSPHHGFLVFDNHERVSLVAQAVHHADEAMNVTRVQADRGLIQNEQRVC
jgi:hypothetical protein